MKWDPSKLFGKEDNSSPEESSKQNYSDITSSKVAGSTKIGISAGKGKAIGSASAIKKKLMLPSSRRNTKRE